MRGGRIRAGNPPYSPFAARFVALAPALAVRFVFAAPACHASFAAFGPPVKNPLTERPKVSTPSFAVRPPVLAPSLAAFLALCRFSAPAAGATAASASSTLRRKAALRLRWSILRHLLQALEPLLMRAGAELGRGAAFEADVAAAAEPRRPEVGAAEPFPHHLGRGGDLALVGDEHRAARGLEALRPARPPGTGRRRAHGAGGSAGTRG